MWVPLTIILFLSVHVIWYVFDFRFDQIKNVYAYGYRVNKMKKKKQQQQLQPNTTQNINTHFSCMSILWIGHCLHQFKAII